MDLAEIRETLTHIDTEILELLGKSIRLIPVIVGEKQKQSLESLDEVDPKLLETYEKLGIPLHERAKLAGVAVDAVFGTLFKGTMGNGILDPAFRFRVLDASSQALHLPWLFRYRQGLAQDYHFP